MESSEYETMQAAEEGHWWYLGLQDLVIRVVRAEASHRQRPLEILDAGCGTGRLAQLLAPFGTVSACDAHPVALDATRRRGVAHVFRADLSAADHRLGRECYDLISCIDVLYHRMIWDDLAALRNLHAALRPGSLLLLQVAAFEALRGGHDTVVHTRHRYRRAEVIERLNTAGFSVRHASYRLLPFFLPMLVWRRCLGKMEAASDLAGVPPRILNAALTACVQVENRLVLAGLRLPFGTSLFAVAQK